MRYQPVQRPENEFDWEDRPAQLTKIKVGNKVWLGDSNYPCSGGIVEVTRLTNTLVIVGKGGEFDRYDRVKWGGQKGGGMFSKTITGIATKEEIVAYDAEQLRKKNEDEQRQRRNNAREDKQRELSGLFGAQTYVCTDHNGDDSRPDTWSVTISGLTEDEVRTLAEDLDKVASRG